MPNTALFPSRVNAVPIFMDVIDGFPDADHEIRTSTGGAPLESGAFITDHAYAEPMRLRLTGWITNRKLGGQVNIKYNAWQALLQAWGDLEPISIVTPLHFYQEMLIVGARAPDDNPGLEVTLEFEEIQRAEVIELNLPVPAIDRPEFIVSGEVQAAFDAAREARGWTPGGDRTNPNNTFSIFSSSQATGGWSQLWGSNVDAGRITRFLTSSQEAEVVGTLAEFQEVRPALMGDTHYYGNTWASVTPNEEGAVNPYSTWAVATRERSMILDRYAAGAAAQAAPAAVAVRDLPPNGVIRSADADISLRTLVDGIGNFFENAFEASDQQVTFSEAAASIGGALP